MEYSAENQSNEVKLAYQAVPTNQKERYAGMVGSLTKDSFLQDIRRAA